MTPSSNTPIVILYVPCKHRDEATTIARALVQENLAACTNVLGEITSFYQWENTLCEETEVVLLVKTLEANLASATARIQSLHSYNVPCVLQLSAASLNPNYTRWVQQSLGV